jgi:hypothetical protein
MILKAGGLPLIVMVDISSIANPASSDLDVDSYRHVRAIFLFAHSVVFHSLFFLRRNGFNERSSPSPASKPASTIAHLGICHSASV